MESPDSLERWQDAKPHGDESTAQTNRISDCYQRHFGNAPFSPVFTLA
jgi:hypothetical protein